MASRDSSNQSGTSDVDQLSPESSPELTRLRCPLIPVRFSAGRWGPTGRLSHLGRLQRQILMTRPRRGLVLLSLCVAGCSGHADGVHAIADPTVDGTAPEAPFEPAQRRDVGDADAVYVPRDVVTGTWVRGVVAPGDLDGDGTEDLVLWGHEASPIDVVPCAMGCPGFDRAFVDIVYGRHDATLVPSARLWGWHINSLRMSVEAAGDTNGDGRGDLLVSIGTEGCEQGNVFVVLGGARLSGDHDIRDVAPLMRDEATCASLGEARGVGDVDGDGLGDYAVASRGDDRLHLFYGLAALPTERRSENDADAHLTAIGGGIGTARGVGDVDGDGLDDFVVGLTRDGTDHAVWLFRGTRSRLEGELDTDAASTVLTARAVRGLGDLDGDGMDELGVTMASGTGYVVRGRAGWPAELDATSEAPRIEADGGAGEVPSLLSGAGDVNGDGSPDLIFGDASYRGEGVERGAAYLFLGLIPLEADALVHTDATAFLGRDWAADDDGRRRGYDRLGELLPGRVDLDGDGFDDLVLPALSAPDSGRVYLWRGRSE